MYEEARERLMNGIQAQLVCVDKKIELEKKRFRFAMTLNEKVISQNNIKVLETMRQVLRHTMFETEDVINKKIDEFMGNQLYAINNQ